MSRRERGTYAGSGVLLATAALLLGMAALAAGKSYRDIPPDFLEVIEGAEDAFNEKNAAGIASYLAEDYSWNVVTPEGAKEMVRGREATVALIGNFFKSDSWLASDFERLGMVGNILVQVEEDTILEAGKPVEKITLNLYEFRNGQRWREWKFYPMGEGPGGTMPAAAVPTESP